MANHLTKQAQRAAAMSLVAVLGSLLASCSGETGRERPRNVILITLDTTRADYLSAYGHPEETTPHLDELTREGTRFDLAISTSSVTPVSHASILTGLNNHEHNLRSFSATGRSRLGKDIPTLATVLRQHGLTTLAVHSAFPVSSYFGFDRGFDVFENYSVDLPAEDGNQVVTARKMHRLQRRSDKTTRSAINHLTSTNDPFFLWVHYWDPHDPKLVLPTKIRSTFRGLPWHEKRIKLYTEAVRFLDSQIGRFLAALRETGRYDDTLFLVVADHGEGLGDHDWMTHRLVYQEQIRVPLIVRVPGMKQVSVVGDLVSTTDIFPTILDFLGFEFDGRVSGRSLRELISGQDMTTRIAFADYVDGFDINSKFLAERPDDNFLYAAMDGQWKLIYRPTRPHKSELFHLTEDPDELVNLYAERPQEKQRLLEELARLRPWVLEPFAPSDDVDTLAETRTALTALGYLSGEEEVLGDIHWSWFCPERPEELHSSPRGTDCSTPLVPILPSADES